MQCKFKRRRYNNATYTWIWVEHEGELLSLGDPWPGRNPERSELEAAAEWVISQHRRKQ